MLLADLLRPRFFYAPADATADAPTNGKVESDKEAVDTDIRDDLDDDDDPEADPVAEVETEDPITEEVEKTLTSFGLPSDDPEELGRHWQSLQSQAQQAREARAQVQALQSMWFQQQQAQRPQQPQEQPKPKLPWGQAPEFDPRWVQLVERDENGRMIAPNGVDPTLPQKIEAYSQWLADSQRKFFADPVAPMQEALAPWVQQQAQQVAQQILAQHEQQRRLADIQKQYATVYYDEQGQLNWAGQLWNQHYQQAAQFGHPAPEQHAEKMIKAELYDVIERQQSQQAPPATPEQQNAAKKMAILKKGAQRTAPRGGAQGRNGRSVADQNGASVFDRLRDKWKDLPEDAFKKSI